MDEKMIEISQYWRCMILEALADYVELAVQGMAGWVHAGMELEDSTREMEDSRRLLQIEEAAGREVMRRLELPDGADGSFFDHKHELRAAEQKSFVEGLERQFAGIGQGIADPVRSRQTQVKAGMAQLRLAGRMFDAWDEVARQKRKQAFDDCFELAVAQGNYGEAVSVVGKAVEDGIVSRERGEVMKLRLAKSQARAQGAEARSVNLGGVEYGGASAALAAQAMRDGCFAAFAGGVGGDVAVVTSTRPPEKAAVPPSPRLLVRMKIRRLAVMARLAMVPGICR